MFLLENITISKNYFRCTLEYVNFLHDGYLIIYLNIFLKKIKILTNKDDTLVLSLLIKIKGEKTLLTLYIYQHTKLHSE